MYKVFIDGKEGTTGLQLLDRLQNKSDIELLTLDDEHRKNVTCRKEMLNAADYVFLCLPDAAAIEAVELVENPNTKVIDASTAHRTTKGWAYGFPELSDKHKAAIINGYRVAVPGCHASGFLGIVYPLVVSGVLPSGYPLAATSITGFSGGGKKMIAEYEAGGDKDLLAPRQYALMQQHKHLKEMQHIAGLDFPPCFSPIVANFYSGMEVSIPLFGSLLNKNIGVDGVYEIYKKHYDGQKLITVERMPNGMLPSNGMSGRNDMKIYIGGNDDRILVAALFDNLGKGASGAAVQCFNLMTGADETANLV